MSPSLLAELREIVDIAKQLKALRERALAAFAKADEPSDVTDAIAAVALVEDARLALQVAFGSLGVRSFQYTALPDLSEDDLVRAEAVEDPQAVYDLRDDTLGGAATNPQVYAGLQRALPQRLDNIRLALEPIERLLD